MKLFNKYTLTILLALTILLPTLALASVTDIGSMAKQAGDQAGQSQDGLTQFIGLIGFVVFVISGFKLFNQRNNQSDEKGKLWAGLFCGVFLLGIWTFVAIGTNTVTNQTQSADDMRAVIKGNG